MNSTVFFILLTLLCSFVVCRPQHKADDFDYRMFEDDDAGVVIDRVLEPRQKHDSHHHHHHHHHRHRNTDKSYLKTNRIQNLRRLF